MDIDQSTLGRMESAPSRIVRELVGAGDFLPGSVLDLGVGTGRNSRFLDSEGFTVIGVDRKSDFDEDEEDLSNITVIEADFADPGFLMPKADNTIAIYSLRFNPRGAIERILGQVVNATSTGGCVVCEDLVTTNGLYNDQLPGLWYDPDEIAGMLADMHCEPLSSDVRRVDTIYADAKNSETISWYAGIVVARVS